MFCHHSKNIICKNLKLKLSAILLVNKLARYTVNIVDFTRIKVPFSDIITHSHEVVWGAWGSSWLKAKKLVTNWHKYIFFFQS